MNELYSELLLEYYRSPPNKGKIVKPTLCARDVNVSCGDEIQVQLKISDGKIVDAKFTGKGCVVSQAAVAMLLENVKGKTLAEVAKMKNEDALALLGIKLTPMRLNCALLGFNVLKKALAK
ncbi:MAG: iron-sulfur cluster assembly scaffold protein [Candidatus Micrarchaeota archaeon]